jgi:hypothetical protein
MARSADDQDGRPGKAVDKDELPRLTVTWNFPEENSEKVIRV